MTIPRETIGQICLWFIIDVFSYLFWVIVLPLGISEFFSDSMFKILFERLL
jgi:replication initiation and membrane attachment protein DnaB